MKKLSVFVLAVMLAVIMVRPTSVLASTPSQPTSWWQFQSIDTMKYSRDNSYQYINNPTLLKQVADEQVGNIAKTGATSVAIATPYDDQFLPVMQAWVAAARANNLHVWFRGNWSGWEGWFNMPMITREQHIAKTKVFIQQNPDLFESGDTFSACPECENGGPGDPRQTGDVTAYRKFLIDEHDVMADAFRSINKNVQVGFNSMNGDVANLIMDKATTQALGGYIVVDHYVKTPEQLNADVTRFAQQSGGKVILGEFGAPIPDIHGDMTPSQQATWISDTLRVLSDNPNLAGMNYWTNMGGSTQLWNDDGTERPAVAALSNYYTPKTIQVTVENTLGDSLANVSVLSDNRTADLQNNAYVLPYVDPSAKVSILKDGYTGQNLTLQQLLRQPRVVLDPTTPGLWYRLREWWLNTFS